MVSPDKIQHVRSQCLPSECWRKKIFLAKH